MGLLLIGYCSYILFTLRFVGELFNLKMLTENIMHDRLFKLLRCDDEVSLECVCTLFSTIGKELDTDIAQVMQTKNHIEIVK